MPLDLERIQAICFDVDGTLSDTDNEWVDRFNRSFSWLNRIIKPAKIELCARWLVMGFESPMNSMFHLLDHLALDDNFARFYEKRIFSRKSSKSRFWLMNGAVELLEQFFPLYPLSIVSARDEVTTMHFVNTFELGKYFREVVTSQTCEHTKPFPHPILWAAERMQVAPENCLMIGDTTVDILAGKAAGAQTIGLLCGFGTEKELRKAGADLIVKELKDLAELFPKKKK
jgi:phosphoglycolate phosphatase-like HAD superfamily hydrolase